MPVSNLQVAEETAGERNLSTPVSYDIVSTPVSHDIESPRGSEVSLCERKRMRLLCTALEKSTLVAYASAASANYCRSTYDMRATKNQKSVVSPSNPTNAAIKSIQSRSVRETLVECRLPSCSLARTHQRVQSPAFMRPESWFQGFSKLKPSRHSSSGNHAIMAIQCSRTIFTKVLPLSWHPVY